MPERLVIGTMVCYWDPQGVGEKFWIVVNSGFREQVTLGTWYRPIAYLGWGHKNEIMKKYECKN